MPKFLAALAVFLNSQIFCALLFASPLPLAKPDIIRLSSKAARGSKTALQKLIRERRRFLELEDDPAGLPASPAGLSPAQRQSLEILTRVLSVLSPRDSAPIIKRPLIHEIQAPMPNIRIKDFRIEGPEYFNFMEGEKRVFDGQKKKLTDPQWTDANERLEMFAWGVKRRGRGALEANVFFQTLSNAQGRILDQSMVKWTVTRSGVEIQRIVLFHSDSVTRSISPSPLDSAQIVRLPAKAGAVSDSFTVESSSAAVQTPWGWFPECLLISGLVEKYSFDRKEGLVAMEVFDRRWIMKGKTIPWGNDQAVSKEDRESLTEEIYRRAQKTDLVLKEVVSIQPVQTFWAAASSGIAGSNAEGQAVKSISLFHVLNRRGEELPYMNLIEEVWFRDVQDGRVKWKQ